MMEQYRAEKKLLEKHINIYCFSKDMEVLGGEVD